MGKLARLQVQVFIFGLTVSSILLGIAMGNHSVGVCREELMGPFTAGFWGVGAVQGFDPELAD